MTYVNRVFNHSCESMPEIPDDSVDCVVTSPPYYGLRDYGIDGQIGLEESLPEYIDKMVAVFREIWRVLKPTGTAWLNIGDSYAGSWGAQGRSSLAGSTLASSHSYNASVLSRRQIEAHPKRGTGTGKVRMPGLKPKDLMMVPHRVAMALQLDGWWVRNDAVWHKPNPMPSSVTDRLTNAHEYVFLLAKSERYFYDADAIREPLAESSLQRINQSTFDQKTGGEKDYANGVNPNNSMRKTLENFASKIKFGGNKAEGYGPDTYSGNEWSPNSFGANKRDVWTIPTDPYEGAHFAVMPRELAKTCILAGSPTDGIVLDPFMGSGTVADVAIGCGRNFVGYELNPDYCKLIRERLGLFGEGVA